jgi:hypothetical protein
VWATVKVSGGQVAYHIGDQEKVSPESFGIRIRDPANAEMKWEVCKNSEGPKPEVPKLIWTIRQQGHAAAHLSLQEFSPKEIPHVSHSKVVEVPEVAEVLEVPETRSGSRSIESKREDLIHRSKAPELGH